MPIPPFDDLTLPVLKHSAERTWHISELIVRISDDLRLTKEDRERLLPSGATTTIGSRVQWAKTYLKQAGLVRQPKRGIVEITDRGRDVLRGGPPKIDIPFLRKFTEFKEFQARTKHQNGQSAAVDDNEPATLAATPDEQIDIASRTLNETLRDTLLLRILEKPPAFFERLIVDLLLAMGYGGSRGDASDQLGGTQDGGVDGVIREDQLGLDRVYLQAKRYQPDNTVSSETVQAFIGALVNRGAHKGVLITTSSFSKQALTNANQSGSLRLVLIDGTALTELLVRSNVGVRVVKTVDIKRVDNDYFDADEPD